MRVDYPGAVVPFTEVQPGTLFAHFAGSELGWAMKIHSAASPQTTISVLLFERIHPTIPAPMIDNTNKFDNRDVLVFKEATLRPSRDLNAIMDSSPPTQHKFAGAVILTEGSAFIRAAHGNGLWDINLATGAARTAWETA
jgi:hypothetical protein